MTTMKEYLKSHGIPTPVDLFTVYRPDNLIWISQGSIEADFPLTVIPENVKAVGPIILASASAVEQDAELATWIKKAPTVMINLGSHVDYDEKAAREMVGAIKILLEQTDVQVLWKFNKRKDKDGAVAVDFPMDFVKNMLGGNIERLRMTKWLSIDPPAMLETGNIAAAVTHGGASSFYEAMMLVILFLPESVQLITNTTRNGVPQVILPLWLDHYEFATRAGLFGIGVWGSRASAPDWTREELGGAFLKVLGNSSQAIQLRENAKEFAKKFGGKPGRERAADIIAEMAGLGE